VNIDNAIRVGAEIGRGGADDFVEEFAADKKAGDHKENVYALRIREQ
jgi:hypothetical protein